MAAEQTRPDVAVRRTLRRSAQPCVDPSTLVFLEERGVNTKLTRRYGGAPKGRSLHSKVSFGHWKMLTFIARLRLSGMTAPWIQDGPMNGDAVGAYIQRVLGKTLKAGDGVVMDNLPGHKVAGIQASIAEKGAQVLYLPLYSPDMNPIEMAFSKLKTCVRQNPARPVSKIYQRIAEIIETITPAECQSDFKAAGYQHSI